MKKKSATLKEKTATGISVQLMLMQENNLMGTTIHGITFNGDIKYVPWFKFYKIIRFIFSVYFKSMKVIQNLPGNYR